MPNRKFRPKAANTIRSDVMTDGFDCVSEKLETVRKRLLLQSITPDKGVNRQLKSIGIDRGKLIRAGLVLLSGKLCGSLTREHIDLATIIEMVHAATLLHDDVIDNAQIRRSQPTANRIWGNTAAILMGDFLLSRAFLAGTQITIPDAAVLLSRTAEQICRGELIQNASQNDWNLSRRDYMMIIESKTASLFAAGCFLAAKASGAEAAAAKQLQQYGRCIGLAFQITDDILDIVGDDEKAGKTLGTDFAQKKITLPVIHFLEQADATQRKQLLSTAPSRRSRREKIAGLFEKSGSLEYARIRARQFSNRAINALSGFKPGAARDAMEKIALAVGKRA